MSVYNCAPLIRIPRLIIGDQQELLSDSLVEPQEYCT